MFGGCTKESSKRKGILQKIFAGYVTRTNAEEKKDSTVDGRWRKMPRKAGPWVVVVDSTT